VIARCVRLVDFGPTAEEADEDEDEEEEDACVCVRAYLLSTFAIISFNLSPCSFGMLSSG
jgi:hypothetical protein